MDNNTAKAIKYLLLIATTVIATKTVYKLGVQDGKNDIIQKASRTDGVDVTSNKIVKERINIKASPKEV